jgi:hypothetical protein
MTEAQVKAAFGDGVQLGDFTNWNSVKEVGSVVGINVGFTTVTAIEANHPYIIKVEEPVTEFTVDGVNIAASAEPKVQVGTKASERGFMYGTYTATKVPEENVFLSGNKFWYSVGESPIKAFRAYFDFYDVRTEVEEAYSSRISMVFENEPTGIRLNTAPSQEDEGSIYTLDGRKVENMKKGVYVTRGKKIVIK